MRIRTARDSDFTACLALDLSYETESAWQMEELRADGEWGARFREVRLPRKQHMVQALPPELRLKAWERCSVFWVAMEQRKMLGYMALTLEQDHQQARIVDMGVSVAQRRQGIASALLDQAIEWCGRQSVEQLIFECPLKDQPAISFALKHRFTFCGFQDAYWPEQTAALFFRKRI